jgi:hypothetical protein
MYIVSVSNCNCLTKFIALIREPVAIIEAKGKGTTFTVTLPVEPKVKMGGEQFE